MLLTINVISEAVCFNPSHRRVTFGGEDKVSFSSLVWFQAVALSLGAFSSCDRDQTL